MLTQAILQELLNYNPDNGLFTWKNKSSQKVVIGKIAGTLNSRGYWMLHVNNIDLSAHRAAWVYTYGYYPKNQIDHINGIKTDNRICNLREATSAQNLLNRPRKISYGYRGVKEVKRLKTPSKFVAAKGGVDRVHIGTFNTPEDAALAYQIYIFKTYGDFLPNY